MTKHLYGIAMILAAGAAFAGTPSPSSSTGDLSQVTYALVSGGKGESSGSSGRSGGSDRSSESGDDRGQHSSGDDDGHHSSGDDSGHHSSGDDTLEHALGDDQGLDPNKVPGGPPIVLPPVQP